MESSIKTSGIVGLSRPSLTLAVALREILWRKPNRSVHDGQTLTEQEWEQLSDAVALSPEIIRVGPLLGFERVVSTNAEPDWLGDRFFGTQKNTFTDAPNAALVNLSPEDLQVEICEDSEGSIRYQRGYELNEGQTLILPINRVRYRVQSAADYAIVRGFFSLRTNEN